MIRQFFILDPKFQTSGISRLLTCPADHCWWGAQRNMVDCILGGGDPAIAADGLAVTAMIEAVEKSIEERRPIAPASLLC